jgi:hypothetical protein
MLSVLVRLFIHVIQQQHASIAMPLTMTMTMPMTCVEIVIVIVIVIGIVIVLLMLSWLVRLLTHVIEIELFDYYICGVWLWAIVNGTDNHLEIQSSVD